MRRASGFIGETVGFNRAFPTGFPCGERPTLLQAACRLVGNFRRTIERKSPVLQVSACRFYRGGMPQTLSRNSAGFYKKQLKNAYRGFCGMRFCILYNPRRRSMQTRSTQFSRAEPAFAVCVFVFFTIRAGAVCVFVFKIPVSGGCIGA